MLPALFLAPCEFVADRLVPGLCSLYCMFLKHACIAGDGPSSDKEVTRHAVVHGDTVRRSDCGKSPVVDSRPYGRSDDAAGCTAPHPFRLVAALKLEMHSTHCTPCACGDHSSFPRLSSARMSIVSCQVGLGSVTNFRTSTDFYYGSSWDIGISSLLIWSLGFAPSKDTFWTTDQRDVAIALGGCPGNGCPADHTAAGAELHTMLAVMSTGPVGFSDAAGRTDAALLRRGSVGHGVVVKPSRPLTSVDSTFLPNIAPAGHVLATRTVWARYRGWFFVYHQLTEPYTVSAADFDRASDVWLSGGVVWREFHAG